MAWQLTIQAESTFVRRDFSHTTASGTAADARETKHDTAYDGDGRAVMENKQERNCVFASGPENCTGTWDVLLAHYLISSVTGQKITTLDDGANYEKNVYMGQTKISRYIPPNLSDPAYQSFTVVDPVTGSSALLESDGTAYLSERTELAALGTSVPLSQPPSYPLWENVENGFAGDAEHGCADDRGDPEPCSLGRVRAHAAGVADRRGKRMAKEPIALLVPKNKPKLPWVVPEKGPSAGLAAHYSGSFGEPDDDALPGIIDETVDIDISDPFGFMVDASHSGGANEGCRFQVNITTPLGVDVGIYNDPTVIERAKEEIRRILTDGGHSVVFGTQATDVAGSYFITLLPGLNAQNPNSIERGSAGTQVGGLYTGLLSAMASLTMTRDNNPAGSTVDGIGAAIGRVTTHAAVIHSFLGLDNSGHSEDGVTRASFDSASIFRTDDPSNTLYRIPFSVNRSLRFLCDSPRERPFGRNYPDY